MIDLKEPVTNLRAKTPNRLHKNKDTYAICQQFVLVKEPKYSWSSASSEKWDIFNGFCASVYFNHHFHLAALLMGSYFHFHWEQSLRHFCLQLQFTQCFPVWLFYVTVLLLPALKTNTQHFSVPLRSNYNIINVIKPVCVCVHVCAHWVSLSICLYHDQSNSWEVSEVTGHLFSLRKITWFSCCL